MTTLTVQTQQQTELVNITSQVKRAVSDAGLAQGVCHVYVPHTTAGVTVNEAADPDVQRDLVVAFDQLIQDDGQFRHAEGNSPAHVKATLTGSSVSLPVTGGRLALGTWQGVYFCEFDGPRRRQVWVTLLGA